MVQGPWRRGAWVVVGVFFAARYLLEVPHVIRVMLQFSQVSVGPVSWQFLSFAVLLPVVGAMGALGAAAAYRGQSTGCALVLGAAVVALGLEVWQAVTALAYTLQGVETVGGLRAALLFSTGVALVFHVAVVVGLFVVLGFRQTSRGDGPGVGTDE